MLKTLALIGIMFFGNIFAAETSIGGMSADDLSTLREHVYEVTRVAGKSACLAKFVIDGGNTEEGNDKLKKEFHAIETLMSAKHPLIVQRSIATKEEATAARAYYLGVKENLFAVTITMAFEIMAVQANFSEIDVATRTSLNNNLVQTFENVQGALGEGPAIELRSIATKGEAVVACAYYRGVGDNLLVRTLAMATDDDA